MLEAGAQLGRFTLVRWIGRGGMGEVWEAVLRGPEGFRKHVALKIVRTAVDGAVAREALIREARLGALLCHPNLVSTLALAEVDGLWLVAMELVRGTSLSQVLRTHGPLPPAAVLEIGVQACAGLHHAHRLRVDGVATPLVHRDVKPANILLDQSGLVKVADLGISSLGGAGGPSRAGTPGFVAPEQRRGQSEDHRVDLYALGAVLCVLASGRTPSNGGLREAERRVPGLGEILARCLRKDPGERHSTAADLGHALGVLGAQVGPGPQLQALLVEARPDLEIETGPGLTPSLSQPARSVGNLPAVRDAFVGRPEAAQVTEQVQSGHRLLTLVGLGGAGKTRLALQVAHAVTRDLPGGAWFFDLSEAVTAEGMCEAVARALDVPIRDADPVAQVGHALAARGRALFVLDNLEQLGAVAPTVVRRWVTGLVPEASFLCTSRMALRLKGEVRIAVDALSTEDGVALFLERAQVADGLDPAEVAAVVQAVEGLPLAIELAASRTRILPVTEVLRRIAEGLQVLRGRSLDAPERHRSVTASLDGTWELLTAPARVALAQMSVFDGGFRVEAAEAVLAPSDAEVLDVLDELCDLSLIKLDPSSGRLGLHALVRTYAALRLTDDARRAVEARHGAYYAQLGADAFVQRGDVRSACSEVGNLVSAARRAAARGDVEVAVRAFQGAAAIIDVRGPAATLVGLADVVGGLAVALEQRAVVDRIRGAALWTIGRGREAREAYEAALSACRQVADGPGTGTVLGLLASLHRDQGRPDLALPCCEEALRLQRAAGNRHGEAAALGAFAGLHKTQGRFEEARSLYEAALRIHRELGHRRAEAGTRWDLAQALRVLGQRAGALDHFQAALQIFREYGVRRSEALVLNSIGLLNMDDGDITSATANYAEALCLTRDVGDRRSEAVVLGNLGIVHVARGHLEEGRAHYLEALALHRDAGDRPYECNVLANLGVLCEKLGRLDEARTYVDEALRLSREVGSRRCEGAALGALGILEFAEGRTDSAIDFYRRAAEILQQVGDRRFEAWLTLRIALCTSEPDEALALLAHAEAGLLALGDRVTRAECLAARATVYARVGRVDDARAALSAAEATGPPDHADLTAAISRARAVVSG